MIVAVLWMFKERHTYVLQICAKGVTSYSFVCSYRMVLSVYCLQVEKLCNRVTTATLPDDRRDAVRGLKAMSKVRAGVTCACSLPRENHFHLVTCSFSAPLLKLFLLQELPFWHCVLN